MRQLGAWANANSSKDGDDKVNKIDALILETTGLADPRPFLRVFT